MKVEAAKAAHNAIIEAGINFIACLPDSAFQELYLPLSEDPRVAYIQVASENDGVGLCMGAWLGGLKPALLHLGHLRAASRSAGVRYTDDFVDQSSMRTRR